MCVCQVLMEERMVENAAAMESVMRRELSKLDPAVTHTLRGRGLFFALVINSTPGWEREGERERERGAVLPAEFTAWDVCLRMKDRGLLAKPTHDDIIRLAPPLVITEDQMVEACSIVRSVINRE